jgi:hypothetical protein
MAEKPSKPRAAYMARAELSLFCECGAGLERMPGGAYVCLSPGCRWKEKEMKAVVMPAAAMYPAEG